jgi:DNA-binding protein YbaB
MQRKSQSVRLVSDSGGIVTVNPDLDGNHEPVEIEVEESAESPGVTRVILDGETADALADAIDEARGRRRRQRGRPDGSEQGGQPS